MLKITTRLKNFSLLESGTMDVLLIMNVGSMNIAPGSLHLDYYEDSVEPFCQTDQFAYEMKNV